MHRLALHILLLGVLCQWRSARSETVSGCTMNNNHRRVPNAKTSVTLSCSNHGFILVRNLTFGVHKTTALTATTPTCAYQTGDCTTRTTFIGMECNGLTSCDLDLNPQYLHICSQYSDYMVLDYSCLQGPSLSVCDNRALTTTPIDERTNPNEHRLFLRSPNYPNEYENALNCSCRIDTRQSRIQFLDFYLEERDEMNVCSRDRLQIANRSYCGSTLDEHTPMSSPILLNSSIHIVFKTNDVITRKGFWFMIQSEQALHASCSQITESMSTTEILSATTTTTILPIVTTTTNALILSSSSSTDSTRSSVHKRRHALSYILLLTVIFVVILLLLNLILMVLCWKQRRAKENIDSKSNSTNRPFFCSIRSSASASSSSSITYGDTPVLASLDAQKQGTASTRYIFQPNQQQQQQHLETTPSTSTTTAPYEDLHESVTLHRSLHRQKTSNEHALYMQQKQIPAAAVAAPSPHAGYNRMIHFPPVPIRCQFSTPAQTFYPPQPLFDSQQHIYETIPEGHCPYQRLAATLRRPPPPPCTCYYEHREENYANSRTPINEPSTIDTNPETLV